MKLSISIAFHKLIIRHAFRHIKHVRPIHTFLRIFIWTLVWALSTNQGRPLFKLQTSQLH